VFDEVLDPLGFWGSNIQFLSVGRKVFPIMGKRLVSKVAMRKSSLQQIPDLDAPSKSYRDAKRQAIIAGLRVMKAPAVLQQQTKFSILRRERFHVSSLNLKLGCKSLHTTR